MAARLVRLTPKNNFPVGTIIQSMLTELQFQQANDTSWILADGRNVSGSVYSTVTGNSSVPDLRGMVLRGKNNGRSDGNQNPDGDLSLGALQQHAFSSHDHGGGNHGHTMGTGGADSTTMVGGGATQRLSHFIADGFNGGGPKSTHNSGTIISGQGGNETRMRNVTVNTFIKINP